MCLLYFYDSSSILYPLGWLTISISTESIGYFPELAPPISPLALQFCAPQLVPALPYYFVESYIGGRRFIHRVIHQDAFSVKVNPVNFYYFIQIPLWFPRAFFQALLFNGILTFGRMIAITFFTAGDLCLPSLKRGVPLALSGLRGLIQEFWCYVDSYF